VNSLFIGRNDALPRPELAGETSNLFEKKRLIQRVRFSQGGLSLRGGGEEKFIEGGHRRDGPTDDSLLM